MQALLEIIKSLFSSQDTSKSNELDIKQQVDIGLLQHRVDELYHNLKTALRRINILEKSIYELKNKAKNEQDS